MNRRHFLKTVSIAVGYGLAGGCLNGSEKAKSKEGLFNNKEQRPNVLLILTDDQGWGDIGYNNLENVYTPNIDQLAEEGVVFNNHYVMPQCTPTRVALFTGRYPGRFGIEPLQATNEECFPIGTPTMARMFKSVGYETYLCGKWHMGVSPENGPNHHGFDYSYGSFAGAVGMYDHRYREGNPCEFTWHRNHKIIPRYENGTHVTDLVAADAVRLIESKHNNPFFMYLAFHAPHTPLDERGRFTDVPTQRDPEDPARWLNEDKIKWFNDPEGIIQNEPDPEKRLLLAAVYHLDYAIGEIVNALDRNGLREQTFILFSSDNGPQVNWPGNQYPDDLKLTDFNQPIPMKGHKTDVWEGGIRVPAFANWRGKIRHKKIAEPTHIIDWFPTLAALLNYQPAEPIKWDGISLLPLIFDDKEVQKRELYWIWNHRINRRALRFGKWKIVRYGTKEPKSPKEWSLYNLENDPQETTDIADWHHKILTQLHKLYLKQRSKDLKQ